jgi:hypothetical protein
MAGPVALGGPSLRLAPLINISLLAIPNVKPVVSSCSIPVHQQSHSVQSAFSSRPQKSHRAPQSGHFLYIKKESTKAREVQVFQMRLFSPAGFPLDSAFQARLPNCSGPGDARRRGSGAVKGGGSGAHCTCSLSRCGRTANQQRHEGIRGPIYRDKEALLSTAYGDGHR